MVNKGEYSQKFLLNTNLHVSVSLPTWNFLSSSPASPSSDPLWIQLRGSFCTLTIGPHVVLTCTQGKVWTYCYTFIVVHTVCSALARQSGRKFSAPRILPPKSGGKSWQRVKGEQWEYMQVAVLDRSNLKYRWDKVLQVISGTSCWTSRLTQVKSQGQLWSNLTEVNRLLAWESS